MSYNIPYSFIPGTKARAQEVNANFTYLTNSLTDISGEKMDKSMSNITSAGVEVIKNSAGSSRTIGEIILSPIPLTDSGLHLLDGSLIQGNGIYSDFVDYIAELYDTSITYNSSSFTPVGSPSITDDGIMTLPDNVLSYLKTNVKLSDYSQRSFEITYVTNVTADFLNGTDCRLFGLFEQAQVEYKPSSGTYGTFSAAVYVNNTTNNTSDRVALNEYLPRALTIGDKLKVLLGYNKNTQTYYTNLYINGSLAISKSVVNQYYLVDKSSPIQLGVWYTDKDKRDKGQIDLKEFSVTVDGVTIFSGYNSPEYFCTELEWQTNVTNSGVCGKFVYDEENNTVRLPKYDNKFYTTNFKTTASVFGNGITLGLTDGTNLYGTANISTSGVPKLGVNTANYGDPIGATQGYYNGTIDRVVGVTTDPAKSGLISDLSNLTTSLYGYYYICVSTTSRTDIQVDIDNIATDLNIKADVNLNNINASNSAKNTISSWSMPDFTSGVTLTSGSTLPCNALVIYSNTSTSNTARAVGITINDSIEISTETTLKSRGSITLPQGTKVTALNGTNIVYYALKGVS
jgi:hypothetical protein